METKELWTIPGEKSLKFLEQSKASEPPCSLDQIPLVLERGEGVFIWDVDGNKYIDFTSGVLVTNLGHNHPGLVKAIQQQAAKLMNCYSFPTPERITASERLVKALPDNLDRVFFLSTGSDATEAALRVARRYTGKQEILSFYGAFHGRTYGAMGVSGLGSIRRGFGVPVPGGIMAPYPYAYRCFYNDGKPMDEEECCHKSLNALDRIVESTSSGDLGAVIVEPYQGAAGFIHPPEGWLKGLELWANERNLILIVDEVQSSFGRTGKMFAIEWENVAPNIMTLGKGLGSGVPASALTAEARLFESMKPGELSSTWGGNPLASAAVMAVLDAMEKEGLPENARKMGEYLKPQLLELKKKFKFLGDVRGRGLAIGLEFVDIVDSFTPSPEIAHKVTLEAAKRGLLLGKVGIYGNVVRVAPPLTIQKEELDRAVSIFEMSFRAIAG